MARPRSDAHLVKISKLAELSGVPGPTIKHYMREGLLPPAASRTSRNMAWYDVGLVPRIQAIKELQRSQFLPLKVIRQILDEQAASPDDRATAAAIVRVLGEMAPPLSMTRDEVIAAGSDPDELRWLEEHGFLEPHAEGGAVQYQGDDLTLLRLLIEARQRGLTPEMLPTSVLGTYMTFVRGLAKAELTMFRDGVIPRAEGRLEPLAEAALQLSEKLIVQLRRRALLPALQELIVAEGAPRGSQAGSGGVA